MQHLLFIKDIPNTYQPEELATVKEYQDNRLGVRQSIGRCRDGHNLKIKVLQEGTGTLDLCTFHTMAYIYIYMNKILHTCNLPKLT